MKYKLPIAVPKGLKIRVTQYYGDKTRVAWYKANGIDIDEHNGIDFCIGDAIETYGTKLVCPFPRAGLNKIWFEGAMNTKGNGIEIGYSDGKDYLQIVLWHLSEVVTNGLYLEGETLGYIGNSGLCDPRPTAERPFNGSHLHLIAYRNGVLIDPQEIFDLSQWYEGEETGQGKDLPPLFWSLDHAKKLLTDLINKFKMKK